MSQRLRHDLYPAITPHRQGHLSVGSGHDIYFEECGNPAGRPVLVVHGGPGGGSNPNMRRFHDPAAYRIILFDQRGCGHSTPNASLTDNTTWHLVADMEALRKHLEIDRWQLFGGSWGSTLSLAYAIAHPNHVTEMVLRGIFLLRQAELNWFYVEGCNWLFPDAHEAFQRIIPAEERNDIIRAYYRRLTDPDPAVQLAAAKAWSIWEGATLSLIQDPDRIRAFGADTYALAFARIECHYFANAGFFERDGELLLQAHKFRAVPGTIVHGRYDVVTPMKNAFDLKRVWHRADLRIVADAGHAMNEPGIIHELVKATRRYAGINGPGGPPAS